MIQKSRSSRFVGALLATATASRAFAHAVVVASTPVAGAVVAPGSDLPIEIRFNSRIDAARSRLTLARPDGSSVVAPLDKSESNLSLRATVRGLEPGEYVLRWQTLSLDGHIAHGEIPFRVGR